jgi:hypothetical protein
MATYLGESLTERDASGRLKVNIATVFPRTATIVTVPPPFHALQREAYIEKVQADRERGGLPPLNAAETRDLMEQAVDLIVDDRGIFIRPDTSRMDLAVAADEILQELFPKRMIKYLWLSEQSVRDVLKRRGESWRVFQPPTDEKQIVQTILDSRTSISCGTIYFYSVSSGSRILTCSSFGRLASLPDQELRKQLHEIATFTACRNHRGCPEIVFFEAGNGFAIRMSELEGLEQSPRRIYEELIERFRACVPDQYRIDDIGSATWRSRMFNRLMSHRDNVLLEADAMELDPELSMRVEWLPGARIDDGELILDPALDESYGPDRQQRVPMVVRGLILNIAREVVHPEYVNIGKVLPSISRNVDRGGRHETYVAQIKERRQREEILQIIRVQKWGIAERLDEGKSLEKAMVESEEYTDYILSRLLACRQLRMNSPQRLTPRKVAEIYDGYNSQYRGRQIWTPYFIRDYIDGTATDRVPSRKLQSQSYAVTFARLFGEAAASNLILGRAELTGPALFDVGDELVVEDERGNPVEIAVTDHVGTFVDWQGSLEGRAAEYARPVLSRVGKVPDPAAFAAAYLDGLTTQFVRIKDDYARNRRAFDRLFQHQTRRQEEGSLGDRWARLLKRLASTNEESLCARIRQFIQAGLPN